MFAGELRAERGLRGDDEDFVLLEFHFGAAGARADEIERAFAALLEFHDYQAYATKRKAQASLLLVMLIHFYLPTAGGICSVGLKGSSNSP